MKKTFGLKASKLQRARLSTCLPLKLVSLSRKYPKLPPPDLRGSSSHVRDKGLHPASEFGHNRAPPPTTHGARGRGKSGFQLPTDDPPEFSAVLTAGGRQTWPWKGGGQQERGRRDLLQVGLW